MGIPPKKIPRQFLEKIPKSDLHVHLSGSLRLSTLIELAREYKVRLPSYTNEGLRKLVFKKRYRDLAEYLTAFDYTHTFMRTPEIMERIAYELAWDNWAEGVCYVEVRFAPQFYTNDAMSIQKVIMSVDKGLRRAKKEINNSKEVKQKMRPFFQYGIIGCAMRMFTADSAPYFRMFKSVHTTMPKNEQFSLASVELVRELVRARDDGAAQIVGFDLAGAEKGYPAENHRRAFDLAHRHFLKKTVHAGEAYGPSSIFQAITECHADRIGHGTNLFNTDLIDHIDKDKRKEYVDRLIEYIGDRRITLEVCLSSNMQTMPDLKTLSKHPFGKMLEARLSTTFCTDNRLITQTTVTDEIAKAIEYFSIDADRLRHLIIYGFKRSFFFGNYLEKRDYVHHVIECYEYLQRRFKL